MRYTKTMMRLLLTLVILLSAVSAAQADDSWMPDKYSSALSPVPSDRIIYGLPAGMEADCTRNALGVVEYVIDTKETDWASVVASAYHPSSSQVFIHPGIRMPENAASQRCMRYFVEPSFTENRILQTLQRDFTNNGPHYNDAGSSIWIGRYDEAAATFIPEGTRGVVGLAVSWYDKDSKYIGSEYLLYTVTYTDSDAFTVSMPKVPENDITLNVPVSAAGHGTNIAASKENGLARYEVGQPEQLQQLSVATAVAVPQIAGKDTSDWVCYMRKSGSASASACEMASAGQYGLTRRSALISSRLDDGPFTEQTSITLEWRDANGQLQHLSHLSTIVICGEAQPWPMYAGITPVPENRLKLTYVNPISSGTKLTYDENTGIAYFHVDQARLPESAAYGDANFTMEFTPPEGATAYAFFNGNGETTFGQRDYVSQNIQNWIELNGRFPYAGSFQRTQNLFRPHHQEGRDLTVYVSDMIAGELASEYIVINWYRDIDDQAPMLTEYVFRRMDNCIRTETSKPLASDDEIPGRFTSTAIVIPNNNSAAQMQFVAEMYPQDSEASRFYELRLLDDKGNQAHLPAKSKIILPYPEGTSFDDLTISFNLRHLNNKYQTFETFSEADGTLHREKDYLWFVPSSLSPFILEWGTAPTLPADLPQTGDTSHPLAAAAALGAACALLYVLKRRSI